MRGKRNRFIIGLVLTVVAVIGLPLGVSAVQNIFTGFGQVTDIKYAGTNIDQVVYQGKVIWDRTQRFNFTGSVQTFTAANAGYYRVELWGGGAKFAGYTRGTISLAKNEQLFVYVGGTVTCPGPKGGGLGGYCIGGWNGGGNGAYNGKDWPGQGGGGATDIRLTNAAWDNAAGLRSRIMVAGGGGGTANESDSTTIIGGHAGGLSGTVGSHLNYSNTAMNNTGGKAGAQTAGYAFGKGESKGLDTTLFNAPAGGGGGYYGGGAGFNNKTYFPHLSTGGGGGSSYISGHNGCNSVNANGTHTGSANHYSGKVFTSTKMIDGAGYAWTNVKGGLELMPKPDGGTYASKVGHSGNGVAKITYLGATL